MTNPAYEWGLAHRSCREALKARAALGAGATQADWWQACERGDWLFWQLAQLSPAEHSKLRPAIDRALERIVAWRWTGSRR